MHNNITIQIKNLTTGYKHKGHDIVVGNNLNAEIHEGEMICMLGPNGAGKSTLLRTLAAFQPQLGGEIKVMSRNLKDYKTSQLSRLVSVVLTDNSSIKNMTARDVVSIGRSPYTGFWGRLREKDRKMVEKCLSWVGITELADRKMQTLSDGERQKVMIAKAIAQETPVIFLDEPTAFLDYPSKVGMMLLLHRLAKTLKKSIFLSTHDLEHALQVADQIWLIDKKRGLTTGIPEDLCADGLIGEYFKHDGLRFDPSTSTFHIQHETVRTVQVHSESPDFRADLLCKALLRNAICPVVSDEENQATRILIPSDGTYRIIHEGEEKHCVTKIEHAVKAIFEFL